MKKHLLFLPVLLALPFVMATACAKTADISTDKISSVTYNTSSIPKKMEFNYAENFAKWNGREDKILVYNTYEDYYNLGINLTYSQSFFNENSLLVILKVGCEDHDYELIDVCEVDGVMRPIFHSNSYGTCVPDTEDMRLYAFTWEYSSSLNYQFGDEIIRTR
jgi:hypothetical protein